MRKRGLEPIKPDRRDYSVVHTFGATTDGLPDNYSIYDGRAIPDQLRPDLRFDPPIPPLIMGCTGETGAFESGIQDGKLYDPQDLYLNTPPGGNGGRAMRALLSTLCTRGPRIYGGEFGPRRKAYFNCYGAGKIDDFDAARIGLWINQNEKRGVYVGSWYYREFSKTRANGVASLPSFNIDEAALHCYLVTGWRTINDQPYLECIGWEGHEVGNNGLVYLSREIYNALMAQPHTGAFTITKVDGISPIPIGIQANIDHVIYVLNRFVRKLFGV